MITRVKEDLYSIKIKLFPLLQNFKTVSTVSIFIEL